MGKKTRSRFVQQQKYNKHLQGKKISKMNREINKSNRQIEAYKQDYDNSVNEILNDFIKENGLDPDKIPNNSRILIYELLRKNIKNKLEEYNNYIEEHSDADNILQYYEAQTICKDSLEQIDWIYNWTKPLENFDFGLNDGEEYNDKVEKANEKLKNSEKKFDEILDLPELIYTFNNDNLRYEFHKFCQFIIKNDLDKYYIYISNTIKNLKILNTNDPIKDFMFKPVNVENTSTDCEN